MREKLILYLHLPPSKIIPKNMTVKFTHLNLALKSRENEHAASPGPSHSNAEPRLHGPAASSLPASTTALHTPDPQFGGK